MTRWVVVGLGLWIGCKGLGPSGLPSTPTTSDTAETDLPPGHPLALPPTHPVENPRFATSDACAACHSNHPDAEALRDTTGREVGPYDLWQASMMANAARDPIWRAVVSAEIAATPAAAELIGVRCMSCHAPMAATDAALTGEAPPTLHTLTEGSPRADLALDGVSCTLCHQIEPDGLGTEASWKGNYAVRGERVAFGPHPDPVAAPMQAAGWTPTPSDHITSAELCASCHTLITESLAPDGTPSGGSLVEQAPWLEMRNSQFATSTCQNCHMPAWGDGQVGIHTPLARQPSGQDYADLPDRSVGRHVLVGGNTLVPRLFLAFPDILNPTASPAAFQAKIAAARAQLQQRTATVSVQSAAGGPGSLGFTVRVETQAGHKFPTGIPLRRAWLHVQVRDSAGATVFRSGAWDDQGRILDGAGALQPFEQAGGPIQPHLDLVTDPDQVVVYEAVMKDLAGDPTFLLLRGAGWLKDNRVLPSGWNPQGPEIDRIGPAGVNGDPDYALGGDRVRFTVDTTGRTGPFTVEAQLVYQTLANRFAEELYLADTPETRALQQMLSAVDRRPETVATGTATLSGS